MAPTPTSVSTVQDPGVCRVSIVAARVDTLYLSGRGFLSEALWSDLVERKTEAQDADSPVPFVLSGEPVALCAGGLNRYPIRLNHRYGFVGITSSAALPTLRFQPLAEFLHGVGPRAMVERFQAWMSDVVSGLKLTVARVDLFADTKGWVLQADDRHRFLSRASLRDTHEDGDEWTGFEFGRHKGGNVMARVYDKSRNIEQTQSSGGGIFGAARSVTTTPCGVSRSSSVGRDCGRSSSTPPTTYSTASGTSGSTEPSGCPSVLRR